MKGFATIIPVGTVFGRLTVIDEAVTVEKTTKTAVRRIRCYPCQCSCGMTKNIPAAELTSGRSRSCRCMRIELVRKKFVTHGGCGTPLYSTFTNMKRRCYDEKGDDYKDYGGRGIKICDEWINNFAAFREWSLSHGYEPGLSIERIDVNKDYQPDNCSWIPLRDQINNRRVTARFTYRGETKSQAEWGHDGRCAVSYNAFRSRILRGWDFERAFTTPMTRAAVPARRTSGTGPTNRNNKCH